MHQRFHHRVRDHDRRRLRGGSGRSSSRGHLGRRLDAGSHPLPEHRGAGSRRRLDDRRRGAGIHLDAGRHLPGAEHLGGVNRGEAPADEECCSGLGAGPFPVHSRTGCYPGEVLLGAGPFPVRSRTGCYPVGVRPGEVRPVLRACQQMRQALRPRQQRVLLQLPASLLRVPALLRAQRGSEPGLLRASQPREPEPELPSVPEREPVRAQGSGVSPAWPRSSPQVPLRRRRQAWRRPLRGQHEACVLRGVQLLMRATLRIRPVPSVSQGLPCCRHRARKRSRVRVVFQPLFSCLGPPRQGGPLFADGSHFEPLISCPLAVQPVLSY